MKFAEFLDDITNFFIIAIEAILGLRLLIRLFGANADNAFARFIDYVSSVLLRPFSDILPVQDISGFELELSTLFAMLVYGLGGMILVYGLERFIKIKTKITQSK